MLDAPFDPQSIAYGPYFFPDPANTSETDDLAAIGSGLIQAARTKYAGRPRSTQP
jgi:hypothetical protein